MFQGAYQKGTKFWPHRWQEIHRPSDKGAAERGNIHAPLLQDIAIVTCCKRTPANDSPANSMCKHCPSAANKQPSQMHTATSSVAAQKKRLKQRKLRLMLQQACCFLLYLGFMLKIYSKIVWNPSLKPNKAHPKNLDEKGGWWLDSITHSKTLIKLMLNTSGEHILVKANHQTMLISRTNTVVVVNSRILQHYN